MPRPCDCDHPEFAGQKYQEGQCAVCWYYYNDLRYRALWDGREVPPPPLPLPVPYADWPPWVKGVAGMRTDGEAGVGDTVKRLLVTSGADWLFRTFVVKLVGDCKCESRRVALNAKYPYGPLSAIPGKPG